MASHPLPVVVSPEVYARFDACVHCGLCLPACPTYVETADEADSPRGRIHLMKSVVDAANDRAGSHGGARAVGGVQPSDMVFEHLDRCLVCRACETACPSGVVYHELIEAIRPQVAQAVLGKGKRMRSGLLQWMIEHVLVFPGRAVAALFPLKLARRIGLGPFAQRIANSLPGPLGAMAQVAGAGEMPSQVSADLPLFTPAAGKCRGNVVLLRGCVGSVVSGSVNQACIQVLSFNGYDVHLLAEEPCCGAMAAHANDPAGAHAWAEKLVDALLAKGGDYFISPIAGCGAQLKALDKILADSPAYAEKAKGIVRRMRDVTEFLAEIALQPPAKSLNRIVAYHDPCHLAHAQRITEPPRRLLALIPGLTLVPLPESDMCCGAAGTYNLNQPEMARRLGQRKINHILETHAAELITANVGCSMQITRHLQAAGHNIPVRHVVEILAESYGQQDNPISA